MANLIELLPFEPSSIHKMDKNSLLELILNYLQMKQYIEKGKSSLTSLPYTISAQMVCNILIWEMLQCVTMVNSFW